MAGMVFTEQYNMCDVCVIEMLSIYIYNNILQNPLFWCNYSLFFYSTYCIFISVS